MKYSPGDLLYTGKLTRRDFLWLATVSTAGVVTGCAMNPVTGERQLMLVSEGQEIAMDEENSPHQFSSDYGPIQDQQLNAYVEQVGKALSVNSHRPDMPYSFRVVNATYVNAYAFPGGSIAATRGILLELQNEAELAGLLGHEIGHVSARHTAERMTKGLVLSGLLTGAAVYAQTQGSDDWAEIINVGGQFAAGALLAHYSRDDERQADALGMEYMTRGGYNSQGMVGLMEILVGLSDEKPSALEMMFATHPMSDERLQTAKDRTGIEYQSVADLPFYEERYMDSTANLRAMRETIESLQKGEEALMTKKFSQAQTYFADALHQTPDDYTGLVLMAKCQMALDNPGEAKFYAEKAKEIYPEEAQAIHLLGVANLGLNKPDAAYEEFDQYERLLPGNPNTIFLKGVTLERMQDKQGASEEYYRYLQTVNEGENAEYAYQRLVNWGVIKP